MHHDDALLTNAAATPRSITGIAPAKPLRGAPVRGTRALAVIALGMLLTRGALWAGTPFAATFAQSAPSIGAFDFIEVTAVMSAPSAQNPFTEVAFTGHFEPAEAAPGAAVDGFCDSTDGSRYRIRFMPPKAGSYTFHVTLKAGQESQNYSGQFAATDQHRRGPLRVDPAYPWHFLWEGTGEHYFFNGTTAYWLVGWRDEPTIQYCIDRLARLKVNRMRVSVSGRTRCAYGEAVMNGARWDVYLSPWPARDASDLTHPDFDYSRFNLPYWEKFERMLRYSREKDVIVSLVLGMNDDPVHPTAGSEDEHRFIRYAVARLGAFSNITWDLGDDLDGFRDDRWTHETGTAIVQWDPYHHLATSHPMKTTHQDRASAWFGFTSYQDWSRNQHALMLESRKLQEQAGRIIPQTNEEYGYEDHYPEWAAPGFDSAEVLRRTAWDIYMAGGYQTAGESARRGTNIQPDTGGGWMNGRGDDTQSLFLGYGHIVDFFTSFEWWKTNPRDDLVDNGNYCLAEPGQVYAVYLPRGGKVKVRLEPGIYEAEWYNATSGQRVPIPHGASGPTWTSPAPPDYSGWGDSQDLALLLRKR
ncbi:MAG: DUF4038 domain-containing protein [Limisphaerales bacterium]